MIGFEHTGPVILEGDWVPERGVFRVVLTFEGLEHSQEFSPEGLKALIRGIRTGFQVGGLSLTYRHYLPQDIGPRTKRSFESFFRELLERRG